MTARFASPADRIDQLIYAGRSLVSIARELKIPPHVVAARFEAVEGIEKHIRRMEIAVAVYDSKRRSRTA